MSLSISAVSTSSHLSTVAAPPADADTQVKNSKAKGPPPPPPAASAAGSSAQQQAALTRMLATYSRDQSEGTDARTLSALGKQILAAAKSLGEHVTLPHASAGAGSPKPATNEASEKGRVNVTA